MLTKKRKNKNLNSNSKKVIFQPDPTLLKASELLTKTYKEKIYNEDCIDLVRKCSYNSEQNVEHNHEHHDFKPKSDFTPYVLLIALSIHGFFEGIALGIQTQLKMVFFLGVAIISHKWAESFTLGVSFYKTNTNTTTYINLMVIFSLFTPLGIIFGMVISGSSPILESIFLALSSGTFIYIAASEVIVEEFSVSKHKYFKFVLFIFGATFIGLMAFLEIANDQ